jgi:hypothetical protein
MVSRLNSDLFEEVKSFVAEFWSVSPDRISAETAVNDDLGMDGDDGVDFLEAFCVRFGVDSSVFPHDKYFGPEAPADPISVIEGIVRRVTTGRWSDLPALTVGDLVMAVERRRSIRDSQNL